MKNIRFSSMLLAAALAASAAVSISCQKEEKEDKFGILTMSLAMPNGQAIECSVNAADLTIDNSADPIETGLPASMMEMTVTYTATLGTDVTFNGAPVVSGETVIDLSSPATLVASKNGKSINYTLTVVSDPNDKSETEGKKVTADMRQAGFPDAAWYDIVMFKDAFWAITSSFPEGTSAANKAYYQVYKSNDGIKWEKVNTNLKVVGAYGARLFVFQDKLYAYGGGRFYGTDEDGTEPEVSWDGGPSISKFYAASSSDGITWEAFDPSIMMIAPTGGLVPGAQMMTGYVDTRFAPLSDKIVYLGGYSVMYSMFQDATSYATSTDGKNWTVDLLGANSPSFSSAVKMRASSIVYTFKGKIYIAGGFKNYLGEYNEDWMQKSIYSSEDGLTWTLESEDAGLGGIWSARVAGTDDVLYLVGGETQLSDNSRQVLNKVYRSTDGVRWEELSGEIAMSANFEGRQRPCVVANGDMLWIFGGRKATSDQYGAIKAEDEVLFDVWKKRIK